MHTDHRQATRGSMGYGMAHDETVPACADTTYEWSSEPIKGNEDSDHEKRKGEERD